MSLTLWCFGESGHSWKVALQLALSGLDWQPRFVDFFAGETRTPAFRALNPMGECPVLVEGDRVMTQSGVIQLHLAERTGRFGGAPEDRDEILRWILFDNHKLSAQAGTARFLRNFLPEDKRDPAVIAFVEGRLRAALKVLDAHLATRDWLVGDGPTIADFANCSYLYYPEPFGFDRGALPGIDRWLTRISALPGWQHPYDLMQRAWRG